MTDLNVSAPSLLKTIKSIREKPEANYQPPGYQERKATRKLTLDEVEAALRGLVAQPTISAESLIKTIQSVREKPDANYQPPGYQERKATRKMTLDEVDNAIRGLVGQAETDAHAAKAAASRPRYD